MESSAAGAVVGMKYQAVKILMDVRVNDFRSRVSHIF